jgi:hypothetical protein
MTTADFAVRNYHIIHYSDLGINNLKKCEKLYLILRINLYFKLKIIKKL